MGQVGELLRAQCRGVPAAVDRDTMASVAGTYFTSYDTGDLETRVSLFADTFRFEDPAGVVRATDRAALRRFYQQLHQRQYALAFHPGDLVVSGNVALVRARATVTVGDLGSATLDLSLLMEVDRHAKIVDFRTFFDERCVDR